MKELFKKTKITKKNIIIFIISAILTICFAFICFDVGRYYEANRMDELDKRQNISNGPCYRLETFSMDVDLSPYYVQPPNSVEKSGDISPDQAKL